MGIKQIIGFVGLRICNILPANGAIINLGQQPIRGFFARLFFECCGKNVNIQKSISASHRCKIGDNSGIGKGSVLFGSVTIGDDVMMGTDCLIYTQNHEFSRTDCPMRLQGFQKEKPVVIGSDVWIGGRVTILPGVHIGNGVVVGAGAVVTKNVPDNVVVAGNPAVIIKTRG